MKLPLTYFGNPILRKKAARVVEINDDIRQLIQDMIETMNVENGIGLAAPQVNQSLAIFITHVPIEGPDDTYQPGELRVFINPKIISVSEETWECSEGCLSIPKLYGKVVRPLKVTFEATGLDGKIFQGELTGLDARAFFHENDHLNGVLYIDRMDKKARQEIEPQLRDIKKRYAS